MNSEGGPRPPLPSPVREMLDEFKATLDLDVHLWQVAEDGTPTGHLYPEDGSAGLGGGHSPLPGESSVAPHSSRGAPLELEIRSDGGARVEAVATLLRSKRGRVLDFLEEVDSFTAELQVRWEEISLLYSISETLGSELDYREGPPMSF